MFVSVLLLFFHFYLVEMKKQVSGKAGYRVQAPATYYFCKIRRSRVIKGQLIVIKQKEEFIDML